MSRPLLFVVITACLSSSVPVWSQRQLTDDYETSRGRWGNIAERKFDLEPSSRNRVFVASEHLAQNAPEKAKSTAGSPAGVEVSIKEWVVPTLGSHPHDPLATPDGSIWYTGQMANLLGRLDPSTGDSRNIVSRRLIQDHTGSSRTKTAPSDQQARKH
jgi:hypothetical protein